MEITQALKSLALDHWFKLLVWFGGLSSLGALFIEVKVLSNNLILPISFGLFLIGLGEWASYKKDPGRRQTKRGNTVKGWEMRRYNNVPGNCMTIIGGLFLLYGIYSIFHHLKT